MRESLRSTPGLWVLGWFALFLGAAGVLALSGRWQEAVKLAFAAALFPTLVLSGAAPLIAFRDPMWRTSLGGVLWVVVLCSWLLFGASLLVWLPLSPWRWRPEDMPAILAVPFVAGLYLFAGASVVGVLAEFVAAIRARDARRVLSSALLVATIAIIAVSVIAVRLRK